MHSLNHLGRRPDEGDTGGVASMNERRILGQKAVAGMDGVRALLVGDGDYPLYIHEGVVAGQLDAFVRQTHVERLAVAGIIEGHGAHAHLATGADDSHRDLAAVGDEDFLEHTSFSGASVQ